MSNIEKLTTLNLNSYNYEERKHKLEFLNQFYFPKFKLKQKKIDYEMKKYMIGTIIRIKHNGTWYDIPFIRRFDFPFEHRDTETFLFGIYKQFLDEAYKTIHLYIVRLDYDFISQTQLEEDERLRQTYE